jgi:hypothetical protein
MNDNSKLQEFVTNTAARGRITFGDLRRLQRDHLPGGVSTFDQAEMLIRLDATVGRTDRAWTEWFVAAIVDFAGSRERSTAPDGSGADEWLKKLLATTGTKTARRIARAIQMNCEFPPQIIEAPPKRYDFVAQPVTSDAVDCSMAGLELAA